MNNRGYIAVLLAVVMAGFLTVTMLGMDSRGRESVSRVSEYHLEHGRQETGAINIVTAVLLDYRGFDTMGETLVILASALAVGALLKRGRMPPAGRGLSMLVRRSIATLSPLFLLMPAYIIVNGHLSPGGGFQGGVGLATMFMLLTVVYGVGLPGRAIRLDHFPLLEYVAAIGFIGIGLYGLLSVGEFLANRAAGFPMGTPGTLLSAGVIPLLNLVIGCKVMAGLSSIFFNLQRDEEPLV